MAEYVWIDADGGVRSKTKVSTRHPFQAVKPIQMSIPRVFFPGIKASRTNPDPRPITVGIMQSLISTGSEPLPPTDKPPAEIQQMS